MGRVAAVEIRDKRDGFIVAELNKAGIHTVGQGEIGGFAKDGYEIVYIRSLLSEITLDYAESLIDGSFLFGRGVSDDVKAALDKKRIRYFNILCDETFIVKNACLTAEGALAYVVLNTDDSIRGMPVLVLGYGRVGKSVTKLLKDNYASVSVATDDPTEYAIASIFADNVYKLSGYAKHVGEYKAIINTVPIQILEGDTLRNVDKNCFLLDLASAPGGIDFAAAAEMGLKFMHALGVPGKVCPHTAGVYIKDIILNHLE